MKELRDKRSFRGVTANELATYRGEPVSLLADQIGEAREVAMKLPGEADIKCPKCSDIMIISKIEGIEVEKCIGCKGIFLDADEIDKIRQL